MIGRITTTMAAVRGACKPARLVAALAVAALAAGCAQRPAAPERPAAAQQTQTRPAPAATGRTVALLAPLSAQQPQVRRDAEALVAAARLALSDAVPQARPELIVLDTRGVADGAAAAAQEAVARGAGLIIGPLFAANVRAAGAAAAPAGVNLIAFSTDPAVAGGNVFLVGRLRDAEARRVLDWAARQGLGRVGLFRPEGRSGDVSANAFRAAAAGSRVSVVTEVAHAPGFDGIQQAAPAYAEAHRAAGADAVAIPEAGVDLRSAAAFLDFHEVSPRTTRYLGLAMWGADPQVTAERSLHGGVFAAPDPFAEAAFADRMAGTGAPGSRIAVLGYDAATAAASMLRRAGGAGGAPYGRAAITDPAGFEGATGPFRFTADGLNDRALAVLEVTQEGFLTVEPAPATLVGAPGS